MPKLYPPHPFANLFPEMPEEDFAELREDIRQNGLREALMLANNQFILDGRHRLKACLELGIEPRYRGITGSDDELLAYVISTNLRRRHLSREQREIIAAQIANVHLGGNQYTLEGSSIELPTSQKQAAKLMDVTVSGLKRAKTVVDKGAPALVEAVRQGKVAVSTAAALADEPPAVQQEIIARGEKEIQAKAKQIKDANRAARKEKRINELSAAAADFELEPVTGDDIKIICADSRDLLDYAEPDSMQLIVTSPPYNVGMPYPGYADNLSEGEYRDLLGSVFSRCEIALEDGGRIAVVVPLGVDRNPYKPFAPFVHDLLVECGFTSQGWIVWDKNNVGNRTSWGSHRSFTAPVMRDRVEIILVMRKGDGPLSAPQGTLQNDATGTHSAFLQDSDYFAALTQNLWQVQPETRFSDVHPAPFPWLLAQRLIHLYAYPGALIGDPFMGTGSTLVAAKKNGCRAIGLDLSKDSCALAKRRLVKEG